ncbi:MAG: hypothetical protein ACRDZO_07335 [Egibacteraceae bacterium]
MSPLDGWPAVLLLPADGAEDARAVWGCLPLPSGTSKRQSLQASLRRELTLLILRRGAHGPVRTAGIHRLSPLTPRAGGLKHWAHRVLHSGVLVELGPDASTASRPSSPAPAGGPAGGAPRLLDVIAEATGAATRVTSLRLGSGGAALARVSLAGGRVALLRMAPAGSPADPTPTAARLQTLAHHRLDLAPRLLSAGETAGIAWTAESLMPGARPRRVSPSLARDAAIFCATLPATEGTPTAPAEDLETLAALLPDRAPTLRRITGDMRRALLPVPAVMRHGDLWAGNLLVEHGKLSGVVDWDAAHPLAMPGTDLLQLIATDRRRRRRLPLGTVWLQRPWRWPQFTTATRHYWAHVGVRSTDDLGELLAIAWWAGEIAGTLRRLPHRATDDPWLSANVDPVIAALT